MSSSIAPHRPVRSLTVYSFVGLAGRLRMLLSGMALAEASGREFRMYWPITAHCGAPFHRLFRNEWPVEDVMESEVAAHNARSFRGTEQIPDLMSSEIDDLHVTGGFWLLRMVGNELHSPLVRRCGELFDELLPTQEILSIVDAFEEKHFRSTMIGVHLRRGDFVTVRPGVVDSSEGAMAAVDGFLKRDPEAGVLLCTDDGAVWPSKSNVQRHGVVEGFTAKYGDRVVRHFPRSLDRTESVAVEDALVELLLLRRTDMFVGTQGSGFSDFAMYRRSVPCVTLHSGETPGPGRSPLQSIVHRVRRRLSAR